MYGFYTAYLKWSEDLQFAKILHSFLKGLRHGCLVYFIFRELKSNGKREFVPSDQVFPVLVVYCSLFLHTNKKLHAMFYP